jgi:hypothetical protein
MMVMKILQVLADYQHPLKTLTMKSQGHSDLATTQQILLPEIETCHSEMIFKLLFLPVVFL